MHTKENVGKYSAVKLYWSDESTRFIEEQDVERPSRRQMCGGDFAPEVPDLAHLGRLLSFFTSSYRHYSKKKLILHIT